MKCMNCQNREATEILNDSMHICSDCLPKYERGITESLAVLNRERSSLQTIRYNGDFFNAKLQSFADLRKSLNDSDYANAIAERRAFLSERVFQLNNELLETNTELAVVNQSLRELGEKQREEIRAKIKEQDDKYQPVKPKVVKIPALKSTKTSPFDRMAQQLAEDLKISFEAAKQRLMGGGFNPK